MANELAEILSGEVSSRELVLIKRIDALEKKVEHLKPYYAFAYSLPPGRAFSEFPGTNLTGRLYLLKQEHEDRGKEVAELEKARDDVRAMIDTEKAELQAEMKRLNKSLDDIRSSITRDFISHEDGDVSAAHTLHCVKCQECGKLVLEGKEQEEGE